jgi:hypothetical protein
MSWCRWGSVCTNAVVTSDLDALNEACKDCPGSDLYIYESVTDKFVCCGCYLHASENFEVNTHAEMNQHILEHDKAGHHVRKSLLELARRSLAAPPAKKGAGT